MEVLPRATPWDGALADEALADEALADEGGSGLALGRDGGCVGLIEPAVSWAILS